MKNIEINIKEQDTYEALLPASISNVVYSSDTVNSMFNLSTGSKIDDAFSAISTNFDPLMANLGIVTVKLWDGTPVEGITLDGGIKDNNGNTPITDANGRAVVSTNTDEFTFSVASLWADISDVPSQSYPKTGVPTYINVTMADKGIRRLEVTSSQTIRFSSVVKQFDVFGVGGGGGGGMGVLGSDCDHGISGKPDIVAWGFGGAGGYTKTVNSITNTLEQLTITIGKGGSGGHDYFSDYSEASEEIITRDGTAGGITSVSLGSASLLSVNGGEGGGSGRYTLSSSGEIAPGTGYTVSSNGGSGGGNLKYRYNRSYPTNVPGGQDGGNGGGIGQGTTTRAFGEEDEALYASGGGCAIGVNAESGYGDRYIGNFNKGGEGAGDGLFIDYLEYSSSPYRGNNGTSYGSGGGGVGGTNAVASVRDSIHVYGGNGASGVVIFRWSV